MRFLEVIFRIATNRIVLGPLLVIGYLVYFVAINQQPHPSLVATKSVVVPHRDLDITIQTNGDVRVRENWQVQFSGGQFTFAFRGIALNRVVSIDEFLVSEAGSAYRQTNDSTTGTFTTYTETGEQFVKWFFVAYGESRNFDLQYTLHGALRLYSGGDQFWWKVIESDRGYTIQNTTVTVHLPQAIPPDQLRAAITTGRGATSVRDGQTIVFTSSDLKPGNELEVRVQFPHGIVNADPPAWQAGADYEVAALAERERASATQDLVFLFTGFVIILAGPLALLLLWFVQGRDPSVARVAQTNKPPSDLAPAIVGTLVNERADLKDVIATIVDLARRGVLKMSESPGSVGDYTFEPVGKDAPKLSGYEQILYGSFFHGRQKCDLSDVRENFGETLLTLQDEMYQAALELGFFVGNPEESRRAYAKWGWYGLGFAIIAGLIKWFVFPNTTDFAFIPPVALALVSIGLIVLSRYMPRRTPKGASERARWVAFKGYLQSIEKFQQLDQAQELFYLYLPYAIALGLGKAWMAKFTTQDTPAPHWFGWDAGSTRAPQSTDDRQISGRAFSGSASGAGGSGGGLPNLDQLTSLDSLAQNAITSLDSMSNRLFTMLNSTADALDSAAKSMHDSSHSSGSSDWSSHDSSSGSSGSSGGWSGGGSSSGGGGGGGSSGFG